LKKELREGEREKKENSKVNSSRQKSKNEKAQITIVTNKEFNVEIDDFA
jgi:hypothetical protein